MEKQTKVKALHVKAFDSKSFEIVDTELPQLKEKEILVNVKYVPLIHYDLMKMCGKAGGEVPYVPCVELSGVVEDAHNKSLIGKKVAFLSLKVGTLQNKLIANEEEVLVLNDDADLIAASQMCCNPFTASGIVDTAVKLQSTAFAITAGNSSVGKIIYRIAQNKGYTCLPIVRSAKRKEELEKEGFENLFDSSDKNFISNLNKRMIELKAHVIFDTLAGSIVGLLMKALPKNGILVNFGTQTHEPYSGIDATDMRWGNKEMKNFLVGPWIDEKIKNGNFNEFKKFIADHPKIFSAEIGKVYTWDKIVEAVEYTNTSGDSAKTIIELN